MNQTRPDIPSLIPNIVRPFDAHKSRAKASAEKNLTKSVIGTLKRLATKRLGTAKAMEASVSQPATKKSMDRKEADELNAAAWCALYCVGSHKIKDELEASAEKCGIGWEAELFDW
jgi:hypothetical protein